MKRALLLAAALIIAAAPAFASTPTGDLLTGVKPGPDGVIDVLTIFAHQDDEAYAGGTLLKLKLEGNPPVRLHLACLTLGDLSGAKDTLHISGDYLAKIRTGELQSAAAVFQADEVIQWDYHDQGLKGANREELVGKLRDLIAKTGAEVVITHDPSGLTRHPDHVVCAAAVTAAFPQSPAQRLYYSTYPAFIFYPVATLTIFHERAPRAQPTVKVDVRKYLKLKGLALDEHASQMKHSFSKLDVIQDRVSPYEWFALGAEK
jgi:N-acetylglucosamine malate deacetylase 2